METTFNYPDYKELNYKLNSETGYFEKQPQRIAFNKLPFELKVEPTQEEKIRMQGANEIIHGRIVNGKYSFFTGIIDYQDGWFEGNDYEFSNGQKRNSLVLFNFSPDNYELTAFYFNRFYIEKRVTRTKFVSDFIGNINQKRA